MRELLKEASEMLSNIESELPNYYLWETHELVQRIESELNKPEPEPVAWIEVGHPMDGPYNCHFMAILPKGKHHVYLEQPDQSARIAELSQLEAEIINTLRELIKAQEYIKELAAEHSVLVVKNRDLEQQLAALQAREPLSIDEIAKMWITSTSDVGNSTIHDYALFARAIKAAHGIGVNHE
jgi:regulator of replication initiation timing